MDLPHSQEGASSSSHHSNEVEENGSMEVVPSTRVCYSPPTQRQNWSIPESIIFYIAKNPKSPELYQKLIKSCKYFFYKNPVIVCSDLTYVAKINEIVIVQNGLSKIIDFNNISQRFWITDCVTVDSDGIAENGNAMSSIAPHIYRCEAEELYLLDQHISWNEYLFLADNARIVRFEEVIVTNESGSIVPVEKLIEVAVNVTHFEVELHENDQSVSSKTVQNLLQIPHFATLKDFDFSRIPDSFDIETFFAYIKKNKNFYSSLIFSQLISDTYKNRLESIIDEIIDAERHDYKVPFIMFDGQDRDKRDKLYDICYRSVNGIE